MPYDSQPQRPPPSFQSGSDRPPRDSRPTSRAMPVEDNRSSFTGVGSVYYGRPESRVSRSSYQSHGAPIVLGHPESQYAYPPMPSPNRASLSQNNSPGVRPGSAGLQRTSYFAQQQEMAMQQQSPNLAAPATPEMGGDGWGRAGGSPGGLPASPTSPAYGDESAPFVAKGGSSNGGSNLNLPSRNYPYKHAGAQASKSSLFNDSGSNFASSTTKLHDFADTSGYDEKTDLPVLTSGKKGYKLDRKPKSNRKKVILVICALIVAAIAAAAAIGIAKLRRNSANDKNNQLGSGSSSKTVGASSSGAAAAPVAPTTTSSAAPPLATTGGDGSIITDENGNTFVYKNPFGGTWVSTPFDDSAQAQADVPPLNQPWDYGTLRIYGVNLGGWLTLEPFIAPALYEPYLNAATPAIDEWTLSENLGANLATTLETHYSTFITEEDFAMIAGAGLNWVRISIPYWAIEVWPGEPFLEGVCWKYFLKAIEWARKYGIRIDLDYHATPGSQNGWNHSSKMGSVNFLVGVMGIANAQRALNYIRTLSEFISQPQYKNVVVMQGIINEPLLAVIGVPAMRSFYLETYNMIRGISGFGQGNGPMLSIHDGFADKSTWAGYLRGADRIAIETHPYLCFAPTANTATMQQNILTPCTQWSQGYNTSMQGFGFSFAGEWSLAVNDCGRFVNGVGLGTREEGTYPTPATTTTQYVGPCAPWTDASTWSAELKQQFQQLQFAHMDGLQNTFFWTWKIGNTTSTTPPSVANPMWSYSYGLEQGYISPNPRQAVGSCVAMAAAAGQAAPQAVPWDGTFQPYMTGGQANPTVAAAQIAEYGTWPPASIVGVANVEARAPMYTGTGTPITLSGAAPNVTIPGSTGTIGPGNGWAQPTDTAGYATPIAGCNEYLNPWSGSGAQPPATNAGCATAAPAAAAAGGAAAAAAPAAAAGGAAAAAAPAAAGADDAGAAAAAAATRARMIRDIEPTPAPLYPHQKRRSNFIGGHGHHK